MANRNGYGCSASQVDTLYQVRGLIDFFLWILQHHYFQKLQLQAQIFPQSNQPRSPKMYTSLSTMQLKTSGCGKRIISILSTSDICRVPWSLSKAYYARLISTLNRDHIWNVMRWTRNQNAMTAQCHHQTRTDIAHTLSTTGSTCTCDLARKLNPRDSSG